MSISPALPEIFGEDAPDLFESLFGTVPPDVAGPSDGRAFGATVTAQTPSVAPTASGPAFALIPDVFEFDAPNDTASGLRTQPSESNVSAGESAAMSFGIGPFVVRIDLGQEARGGNKPAPSGEEETTKGNGKNGTTDSPTADPALLSSYTSGGEAATSYNIEVIFEGTWTEALQQAFITSADYISSLILGDVTDITRGRYATDDITITATLTDIDGDGGVLGRAGPTAYRSATYLPVAGIMEFDVADAEVYDAMGLFDDIVFHEMMHTLGFGTMWEIMGLTSTDGAWFIGENAVKEYGGWVPIETDGGAGTAGGHWDEETFSVNTDDNSNEIMTGYINWSNFLSTTSVAALEDMGYDTIYDDIMSSDDQVGIMPAEYMSA